MRRKKEAIEASGSPLSVLIGVPHSSQVQSYRFFLTGTITPVEKYLQMWFIVFRGAVNARLLMVRLNKTKPEGYMWPLDVPGLPPCLTLLKNPVDPGFRLEAAATKSLRRAPTPGLCVLSSPPHPTT
jgi:hypothetical protein